MRTALASQHSLGLWVGGWWKVGPYQGTPLHSELNSKAVLLDTNTKTLLMCLLCTYKGL